MVRLLILLVSAVIVCSQNVNTNHPWLKKLATSTLNSGRTGTCVRTVLNNMDRLGVPSFAGGTAGDPNNPRGSMALMFKTGKWTSLPLPGAVQKSIKSTYGTVNAYVIPADKYKSLATAGQIPSGALVWQTKHGWGYSGGSSGNDLAIVRNGGKAVFNYEAMNFPLVYGAKTVEVVVGVPTDALGGGGPQDTGAAAEDTAGAKDEAQAEEGPQDSNPNQRTGESTGADVQKPGKGKLPAKANAAVAAAKAKGAQVKAKAKDQVNNLRTKGQEKLNAAKQKVNSKVNTVKQRVNDKVNTAKQRVNDKVNAAKQKVNDAKKKATNAINKAKQRVTGKVADAKAKIGARVQNLRSRASNAVNKVKSKAQGLAAKIKAKAGSLIGGGDDE